MFDGINCKGEGTKFTALKKGDRIRPGKSAEAYRLKEVISDTEAILAEDYGEASPRDDIHGQGKWTTYDVLGHVDQAKMFESVQAALAAGNCLGIFPEGGSHDRTDLLPLKVHTQPHLSHTLTTDNSLLVLIRRALLQSHSVYKRNMVLMFQLFPLV